MQELARYWATEYDWRRCEARLNALPQFTTEIDGVDIHFIHVQSPHENALPLIMTHGWPGSVIELLETVGPLTDPTAHGGRAEDAFDLVLPSLPGYGFSGEPTELGWDPGRIAQRLGGADAPPRLHPLRRPGRRRGRRRHRRDGPPGARGAARHPHQPARDGAGGGPQPADTEEERAALAALATFRASGFGYFLEQATRPQTIGYALLDSPVALAAWMLDHDTDSYYKISRAFVDGQPVGQPHPRPHPRQHHAVLADGHRGLGGPVVLGERTRQAARAAGQAPPAVSLPVGFTTFPGEIFRAPRSWVEQAYPNAHLLQRGRQGRPLRRLGGARAVRHGDPRRVQARAQPEDPRAEGVIAAEAAGRRRASAAAPGIGLQSSTFSFSPPSIRRPVTLAFAKLKAGRQPTAGVSQYSAESASHPDQHDAVVVRALRGTRPRRRCSTARASSPRRRRPRRRPVSETQLLPEPAPTLTCG